MYKLLDINDNTNGQRDSREYRTEKDYVAANHG